MLRPCRAALLCLVCAGCLPDPSLQIPDFAVPYMPYPDASTQTPDLAVKQGAPDGGTDAGGPQTDAGGTSAPDGRSGD